MLVSTAEKIQVLAGMADDFLSFRPRVELTYTTTTTDSARSLANRAQLKSLASTIRSGGAGVKVPGMIKLAFDTRRVNQDEERNPRSNLQYWHRQDPFVSPELQIRIDRLARMLLPLQEIKTLYSNDSNWHTSYVRKLAEDFERILRVREADSDIVESQISYLEQLLNVRYQLTTERLDKVSAEEFKSAVMMKDEDLLKVGMRRHQSTKEATMTKDGLDGQTGQSIINAIFGNNQIRRDGEKTVTRTITISITDTVGD
jgi:hypothetical protein